MITLKTNVSFKIESLGYEKNENVFFKMRTVANNGKGWEGRGDEEEGEEGERQGEGRGG